MRTYLNSWLTKGPVTILLTTVGAAWAAGYRPLVGRWQRTDGGYPGSSYTLLYDPDKDALLGFYYQAAQKQDFDVIFARMK